MINKLSDILDELILPFKYDEIFYNSLISSYEFMMDGELMAELKATDINHQ
jgi:hypothetical protein